mmetsp:Transcript_8372/g.10989  ORF Transcript_8372/g.10989 Transcript_8372/m.10989 type:complete len:186 (-) Transcript_8372:216-773(-)
MSANPQLLAGIGAVLSIFLSSVGCCYGSVHAGIFSLRTNEFSGCLFAFAPIVITGLLSIYGIIFAVVVSEEMDGMNQADAYKCFLGGLSVGLSCLVSGLAIGWFLQKHLSSSAFRRQRPILNIHSSEVPLIRSYEEVSEPTGGWGVIIVLFFLETIGLLGLIVAFIFMRGLDVVWEWVQNLIDWE